MLVLYYSMISEEQKLVEVSGGGGGTSKAGIMPCYSKATLNLRPRAYQRYPPSPQSREK